MFTTTKEAIECTETVEENNGDESRLRPEATRAAIRAMQEYALHQDAQREKVLREHALRKHLLLREGKGFQGPIQTCLQDGGAPPRAKEESEESKLL